MRPRQWVKNVFVLPALLFSKHVFEGAYIERCIGAVLCFCLLSGVVYLLNDIFDREQDRLHPEKCHRPIAAGKVALPLAWLGALVLLVVSLVVSFWLHPDFGLIALIYAVLNGAYSLKFKHVVLVDVLIVASGFLLRALGGGLVIDVAISAWFIICTFMLALFLAVVKRRQEILILQESAGDHRAILKEYSLPFLDQLISALTAAILVCYALYAMGVGDEKGTQMQWTIPFVLYGMLRYLYLVYHRGRGENPTTVIWSDRPLQINALFWLAASALGLYVLP